MTYSSTNTLFEHIKGSGQIRLVAFIFQGELKPFHSKSNSILVLSLLLAFRIDNKTLSFRAIEIMHENNRISRNKSSSIRSLYFNNPSRHLKFVLMNLSNQQLVGSHPHSNSSSIFHQFFKVSLIFQKGGA